MWHSRIFSFGTLFLALSLVILSPVWATSSAFSTFTSKASDLRTRIDDARAAVDGFNGGMMEAMSVAKSLYSLESARRETFDQANQCDVFTGDEMLELMNHMEGFHDSVLKALQSVASKNSVVESLDVSPIAGGLVHGLSSHVGRFHQITRTKLPAENSTLVDTYFDSLATEFSRTKALFQ